MQYLLTEDELEKLKATHEVQRQVEARVAKLATAISAVLQRYGSRMPIGMLEDLQAAIKSK